MQQFDERMRSEAAELTVRHTFVETGLRRPTLRRSRSVPLEQEASAQDKELRRSPSKDKQDRPPVCPPPGLHDAPQRTTVVVHNFPKTWLREDVQKAVHAAVGARYDFIYVPTEFQSGTSLGYAFLNFCESKDARHFMESTHGREWGTASQRSATLTVSWGLNQGLEANIDLYRNSSVMSPSVDLRFKPAIYADGQMQPFPAPTKRIRKPKPRRDSQFSEKRQSA